LRAVIDLHSHVLPGLDDGAADLDEAVRMCQAAAADGIEVLAGTPHVRDDFPTTPERMERALAELRAAAGDAVRLVGGGELALSELERPATELTRFALAGNPGYLLVETPYVGWPLDLGERLFRLHLDGITPILAHPERNPEVQRRPALLEPLVAGGALVQLTAASVDGRSGSAASACVRALLGLGLAHLIASDAHAPGVRSIGMSAAARAVGDAELARWLTEQVPRSIVEGAILPPRPQRHRSGLLARLRRRQPS
jgi:protein-tyrosine phosphatase